MSDRWRAGVSVFLVDNISVVLREPVIVTHIL
jgi:hypothetical protein